MMKLTKECKVVLDTAIKSEPTLLNDFHYVPNVAKRLPELTTTRVQDICETLANAGFIRWIDKQHTAFALNETGRNYKGFDRLEKRDIWVNRFWGFVVGVAMAWLTSGLPEWLIRIFVKE